MFLFESNLFSFILPASTTKTQSSMVMDVSARLVEITILRLLVFSKTADWNSKMAKKH